MSSLEKPKDRNGPFNVLWICAEKARTTLKVNCDETGNEELAGDEREWARAVLEIRATTPIAVYNYGLRHAVQVSECKKMLRSIRKVQKKNLPYCILGYYLDKSKIENGRPKVRATFYQLKSPLGYVIDMDYQLDEK